MKKHEQDIRFLRTLHYPAWDSAAFQKTGVTDYYMITDKTLYLSPHKNNIVSIMKNAIIISFLTLNSYYLNAQFLLKAPYNQVLESIAQTLINYEDYQTNCTLSNSYPYGGSTSSESVIITMKVPSEKLCGFYYHFKSGGNSVSFYDNAFYITMNGSVIKTSFSEKPEDFFRKDIPGGFIPANYRSSMLFQFTPYQIGEFIKMTFKNIDAEIYQKPDTSINHNACLRFIIKDEIYNLPRTTELCFHKDKGYPVYFREIIQSGSFRIISFSNSKINSGLTTKYFSEENLFGKKLNTNDKELTKNNSLEPGEIVPEWELPVLGTAEMLSSKRFRGKYVLLEFTATWCGYCGYAAQMMNRVEYLFKDNKKVAVICIFSSDLDKKEQVLKFTKEYNTKSIVLYSAKNVGEQYKVNSYPKFFIVGTDGKLLNRYNGYDKNLEDEIVNTLKKCVN